MFSGTKRANQMRARAYVLFEIVDGNCEYAVQMLRSQTGVVFADWLEGRPDIIAIVEASNRQRLAEAMMPIIGCIEDITEDLHLLLTRDNETLTGLAASYSGPGGRKVRQR